MHIHVAVTGSQGFLGQHITQKLKEQNIPYTPIDLQLGHDITHKKTRNLLTGATHCLHLAALADLTSLPHIEKTMKINAYGTYNIALACAEHGATLIYASTCCIYGGNPSKPWTEQDQPIPTEPYAMTKLMGEAAAMAAPQWNILRLGTLTGAGQRPTLATSIFMEQAVNRQPYTIHGTGEQRRNWLDAGDAADAFIRLTRYGLTRRIYNIAGEKPYSINDLTIIIHHLFGEGEYKVKHLPQRRGDFDESVSSLNAKLELGWLPQTPLRQSLKQAYTARYIEQHA